MTKALTEIITVTEAAKMWGKDVGNLRRVFIKGEKFEHDVDVRKSGATWLVTKKAMEKVYGEPKEINI